MGLPYLWRMPDATHHLNAALEDRYRFERVLGEGGMATVYLAEDLRHGRHVALKVLRPELAAVVGGERFLSEIRTTANLQHPHILPLFDSGEADGFLYYVMPHVRGESLRERLDRETQLGVEEAVQLVRKVGSALSYAHENGVVHRDVKPANILLSEQGEPLVADFGIALAVAHAGAGRLTETGLSLGTPHYMSPEQATGDRAVDQRSDLYALGCVLYEMLAGEPPFTAPTAQAVLVQILTTDAPPVTRTRRTVPPHVAAALARALEKLPADRFATVAEFTSALADPTYRYKPRTGAFAAVGPGAAAGAGGRDRRGRGWALPAMATLLVAALVLAAWGWLRPPPASAPVTRAILDLGDLGLLTDLGEVMVSPDGRRLAVAGLAGNAPLFWRNADEERFFPLPGTEGVEYAAFSPDGEWLAFGTIDGGAVQRVSLAGGWPQRVAATRTPDVGGLDWGDDGTIVFTLSQGAGLFEVAAGGGEPRRLLPESTRIRNPKMLPGGHAVIYTDQATGATHAVDRRTGEVRTVQERAIDAQYVDTGYLLYVDAAGTLWAAPFDPARSEITGDPVTLFDGLSRPDPFYARFSVSRNGTLVYGAGSSALFDGPVSAGRIIHMDGTAEPLDVALGRAEQGVQWSPDGRRIVYSAARPGDETPDIWTYDLDRDIEPRQLTFEGVNGWPVFSPDGSRIAFASEREGTDGRDVFVRALDDDTPPRSLLTRPGTQVPADWPTPDTLLIESGEPSELWVMDLSDPDRVETARYLHDEEGDLWVPQLSPDGTLILYDREAAGEESGVYIRRFPVPGVPTRVSGDIGWDPRWSPDGRTVYYMANSGDIQPEATIMAARIAVDPTPVVLSRTLVVGGLHIRADFDLHPAGDRFVVFTADVSADTTVAERFIVATNWFQELRARADR
jgi:Tol biopolymer transport system component